MIFDSHCHYNLSPLSDAWQEHWQTAQSHQVHAAVVVGTDLETSRRGKDIAQQTKGLFASVGIHPNSFEEAVHGWDIAAIKKEADRWLQTADQELTALLTDGSVVAIGETGLDFFHLRRSPLSEEHQTLIRSVQQDLFRLQIALATRHQLPLIIHVRDTQEDAYWQTLELLKQTHYQGKFVLHCISGPVAYVQEALSLGATLGVAGNVTYPSATAIRALVAATPKDRIMLETDAPFLPPQGYRGQTCFPWLISKTEEFVTTTFTLSPEQLWQTTTEFYGVATMEKHD